MIYETIFPSYICPGQSLETSYVCKHENLRNLIPGSGSDNQTDENKEEEIFLFFNWNHWEWKIEYQFC